MVGNRGDVQVPSHQGEGKKDVARGQMGVKGDPPGLIVPLRFV